MEQNAVAQRTMELLKRAWRVALPPARWALGWFCLISGVLGLILPIIPGIPLLIAGVALVGRDNCVVCWCEERYRRVLALLLERTPPHTLAGMLVRRCHELSAPKNAE